MVTANSGSSTITLWSDGAVEVITEKHGSKIFSSSQAANEFARAPNSMWLSLGRFEQADFQPIHVGSPVPSGLGIQDGVPKRDGSSNATSPQGTAHPCRIAPLAS